MAIDLEAPLRFLHTAFRSDDWIAILLKSHDTGGSAQRVGPMSLIASPRFQAWLRAENARLRQEVKKMADWLTPAICEYRIQFPSHEAHPV